MKKTLLVFMVAMLFGAWLIGHLERDSGYVLIALGETSVEMSLWFALAAVAGTALALWLVWALVSGIWLTLRQASRRVFVDGGERAHKRTARGLIDFIEGDWKHARKRLLRAAPKTSTPMINYLAAARCAYELGDREGALADLHRAEQSSDASELAVALTQARMQLSGQRYEQCLATLERVRRRAPKHPVVLDLLRQVYLALQDWDSLRVLLKDLRRYRIGSEEELDQLEQHLHLSQLRQAGLYTADLPLSERREALKLAWQKVPGRLQRRSEVLATYAQQLVLCHLVDDAEQLIRRTLPDHWHASLVRLYGLVHSSDPKKQLLAAETWLKQRPGDALLLLTLGRLSLRNQLWGRAREYFQSSLRLHEDPETFAELARLLAHLGEHKLSTAYYQKGLLMATDALPELPQPESAQEPAANIGDESS